MVAIFFLLSFESKEIGLEFDQIDENAMGFLLLLEIANYGFFLRTNEIHDGETQVRAWMVGMDSWNEIKKNMKKPGTLYARL